MGALHCCLAFCPLAVYLLLLGILNLRPRPFLTTGARDLYALGIAISGFVIIGPMDLFMPRAAADRWGPFVWLLLLAFYLLCLTLAVLLVRPRLVIYNFTAEQLRHAVAGAIRRLGVEHHWAGDSVALPSLGVELQIERFPLMQNVSLVAGANLQSFSGWRRLERALARELEQAEMPPSPVGLYLVSFSLVLLAFIFVQLAITDPHEVAAGFRQMLRM